MPDLDHAALEAAARAALAANEYADKAAVRVPALTLLALLEERKRLRRALEKLERGQEIKLPDGTTVVEDHDDVMEIARAAITGKKEPQIAGIPVVVDHSMPADEIEFRQHGKTLARVKIDGEPTNEDA